VQGGHSARSEQNRQWGEETRIAMFDRRDSRGDDDRHSRYNGRRD
jgi:hypothetical protein